MISSSSTTTLHQLQAYLIDTGLWQQLLGWLTLGSLVTFIASLLFIPWLVGKLPRDYFLRLSGPQPKPFLSLDRFLVLILCNIFGLLLLIAGIAMLFLPGQGLLTLLFALVLISFPGKQRLLRVLIGRPKVQHSLDWLRKKQGAPPFTWPPG